MTDNRNAIEFDACSIIFGKKPAHALRLADEGLDRSAIEGATGKVLGVHDASLNVAEGEIVVLMGLSGSGKSTLLRVVNGLNKVARGDVRVRMDGGMVSVPQADAQTLRKLRLNHVSMVFQQFGLLPWRSVAVSGSQCSLGSSPSTTSRPLLRTTSIADP